MTKNPQPVAAGPLQLPPSGFGSLAWFTDAIKAFEDLRDPKVEKLWRPNVEAYLGEKAKKSPDDIPVNVDFYNTEQKKAQLYFRTPEVNLTAKRPEVKDAVPLFKAVLNHYLGPHKVNLAATMDECLFDGLCPAGFWAAKVGYEATQDGMTETQVGMKPGEPAPGSILGLNAPMVPDMRPVPRIIHERYFIERISPAKAGWLTTFHGSDYDRSPLVWQEFAMDVALAKRKKWVPADFQGTSEDKHKLVVDPNIDKHLSVVKGYEVWIRACYFDETAKHPELVRQLVLIDGMTTPAVYRDSPYQQFDPQTGKLTAGMIGFPIKFGTLRYVSDSAFPPSDCTISRAQVDELAQGRGQMVEQRKKSLPMRTFDRNRVDPNDIDRLKRGEIGAMIPVDGNGQEIISEIARAQYPRENFTFVQIVQQDIDKEWALSKNASGQSENQGTSATEVSLIQSNINVRQDYERAKVLGYAIKVAEALGSLIQLFADDEDYIEVLGPDGDKRLQAWDKTHIQGEFAYSAKPDSAQRLDAAQEFERAIKAINYMAKSPYANQAELSRYFWTKAGEDPAPFIQQPQPPPPEKPGITFSFKGADLAIPEVRSILGLAGIPLEQQPSPEAMAAHLQEQAKGLPHGGSADKQDVVSKHGAEATGQLPGNTSQQASVM